MTEANLFTNGAQENFANTARDFGLHLLKSDINHGETTQEPLHDQLFISAIEEHVSLPSKRYEDIDINIAETRIIGNNVLYASRETRRNAVLSGLKTAAPDAIEADPDTKVGKLTSNSSNFLNGAVKVDNDARLPRKEVLHPSAVVNVLEGVLRQTNDPVIQAYDKIVDNYADQLEKENLEELLQDIVLISKQETVKSIYKSYTKKLRVAGSNLLRLMTQ